MGLWGFSKNVLTGGASGNRSDTDRTYNQLEAIRNENTKKRLGLYDDIEGPKMSQGYSSRLKALQEMQKDVPLSQNAAFQGDRARMVRDSRQEVAGMQNQQAAHGLQGGFSSIQGSGGGSVQDAYDRLSGQLSGLGQKADERRDQAGQEYAELDQNFADNELAFQQEQARMKDAILKGDLEGATNAYENALELRNTARSQSNKAYKGAIKGGVKTATKMFTGGLG